MECMKVPNVKKAKKKPVKDDLDRIKKAEKKRRRLEKALATSAAIRSELEMKKQKKIEEQQRLDKEGAAIAEAVALHVLLGEDSDDPCELLLNNAEDFDSWHYASSHDDVMIDHGGTALSLQDAEAYAFESSGWIPGAFGYESQLSSDFGDHSWSLLSQHRQQNFHLPCYEDGGWGPEDISAALVAARAVSSLQIGENAEVDALFFPGF